MRAKSIDKRGNSNQPSLDQMQSASIFEEEVIEEDDTAAYPSDRERI